MRFVVVRRERNVRFRFTQGTIVDGSPSAEADMHRYFRVTPPSVHQMVLTLEINGFIERIPGQGRSIRLLIPREQLPDLE